MKQILHIFVKDMRRFWPEILVSLAITAAFAWFDPKESQGARHVYGAISYSLLGGSQTALAGALTVLVPVTWWLLISRVILAESLVGDRQFWLTRPYEWKNLLAAKLLFVAAFVYLPIFIAQWLLLIVGGFNPVHYLPGLLYNLLLLTGTIILPLAALAAVTSNFARLTLTLLGVFAGLIALGALAGLVSINSSTIATPIDMRLSFGFLFSGCAAAIAIQYARRNAKAARLVLLAIPAVFILSGFIAPDERLMDRTHPVVISQTGAPVQLSYNPDPHTWFSASPVNPTNGIAITIPVRASVAAEGTLLVFEGMKVVIEAPDGSRWTSPWERLDVPKQVPGENHDYLTLFMMPGALYKKWKGTPLRMHITYELSLAKAGPETHIAMPLGDFAVPDFGVCSPLTNWMLPLNEATGIVCRSALRQPTLTYLNLVWSDARCKGKPAAPGPGVQGSGWAGTLDSAPADFGISSVKTVYFPVSNNFKDQRSQDSRYLCPGTPLTFTRYDQVQRAQAEVSIQGFLLPDLPPSQP
jgi:hypothetical protein